MQSTIRTRAVRRRHLTAERRASRGDTSRLLRLYCQERDESARARLVELHLPLVRALAWRYARRGDWLEDLVQVGSIGLIEAIDRFDPERSADFQGYAIPTIAGEMKRYLRDRSSVVRIPRRPAELALTLRAAREALTARLCRPPSVTELAEEAGVREDEVREALETERARQPVELTTSSTFAEVTADDAFAISEERLLLAAGFRTLGERERRILHLRYFGGLSQSEIAREVGLSQNQVSRLIQTSLERLRGALDDGRTRAGRGSGEQQRSAVPCTRDPSGRD